MVWTLKVTGGAEKDVKKFPAKDLKKIRQALLEMEQDPFSGDVTKLSSQPTNWRRRVGSYRIFFDIYPRMLLIVVSGIRRRTSNTY